MQKSANRKRIKQNNKKTCKVCSLFFLNKNSPVIAPTIKNGSHYMHCLFQTSPGNYPVGEPKTNRKRGRPKNAIYLVCDAKV